MNSLQIQQTEHTPGVRLDSSAGLMEFTGRSLPPDVLNFYQPVIDWVNQYLQNPKSETRVVCKMDYFNTASSKLLLDIFIRIRDLQRNGKKAIVEWHYDADDEDLLETGKDYSDILGIPFTFCPN